MPEDVKQDNANYDTILDMLKQQDDKLAQYEKKLNDVTTFNKTLLSRKLSTNNIDETQQAKDKIAKWLEED